MPASPPTAVIYSKKLLDFNCLGANFLVLKISYRRVVTCSKGLRSPFFIEVGVGEG